MHPLKLPVSTGNMSRYLRVFNNTRCNLAHCRHFSSIPWFVELEPTPENTTHALRPQSPPADLPTGLPEHLLRLYSNLSVSPLLSPGTLEIRTDIPTPPGPPLPFVPPRGRRRRGGSEAGLGVLEPPGSLWRWIVIAQVKEGTENRGAIQSIGRIVRKTLLTAKPPLPLPPNRKQTLTDGWAVIDAGDFAVNILSKSARHKYFPDGPRDWE